MMSNEIIWFILLIVNYSFIMLFYKLFGKYGLYAWVPITTILANIQATIYISLFGFEATIVSNLIYVSGFLVTDILSENYSKKDSQRAVYIGFLSLICATVIMQICILFIPTAIEDNRYEEIRKIFAFFPRLIIASLSAYILAQSTDVYLYHLLKKLFPSNGFLWLRNNISTIISQLIDNFIFISIAFIGVLPKDTLISVFISSYLIKIVVALLDTVFIYMAKYLKDNNKINETHIA